MASCPLFGIDFSLRFRALHGAFRTDAATAFRAQVKLAAGFCSLLLRHVYLSSVWHLLFPLRFRALHGAFRTDAATVARHCPAYDRFTVFWLLPFICSLRFESKGVRSLRIRL